MAECGSDEIMRQLVRTQADDAVRDMRYLCSCDAERLSDYQRINMLVKTGNRLCAIISDLQKAIKGNG